MTQMDADVAIVGAGPGGSTLAALLARRGLSVALIDRDAFPRDKLCGEFLSYDALPIIEALGIDLDGAPEVTSCRVVGRNRTYAFDFPHTARGVSRMFLDAALHRCAIERGAQAITATATAVSRDSVTFDGGIVRARVVAGAWGRWGRFDQQLGRAFVHDRSHRNFGFKRHYRGDGAHGVIELYSFAHGYLGVNDVEDGVTNICGLVHASRLQRHKGRWDAFVETIRAEERPLESMYARYEPAQDGFLSSEPVIFRARSAVEEGIFMIGDASGVIDPLTGNGMAMAMQSAVVATSFISDALSGDRDRSENGYRNRHAEMFGPRIAWSRRAAFFLSRPALLDAALRIRPRNAGEFFLRKTRADRDAIEKLVDLSS
ncbi:MAG: NAD(P)/FAD-dependent oxidoreductase [Acidobacteria bacterium]|nr:NAD(P)/FAD-dependent oxidoreductase [Acidobacteriota bacterium]MBV9067393.1 NAD(P)/FAD-dependent oxidoreductase [Acidobacteriota bacterium]